MLVIGWVGSTLDLPTYKCIARTRLLATLTGWYGWYHVAAFGEQLLMGLTLPLPDG